MAQTESTDRTVEIGAESLAQLVNEAERTVASINDPAWHELAESDGIKTAIEDAHDALAANDDPNTPTTPTHYKATLHGREYDIVAQNEAQAKIKTIEQYKQDTPSVGLPAEELIADVSLTRLIPTVADGEDNECVSDRVRVYRGVDDVANGDPYVAVLAETNDKGVPIDTQTITLGTGFESYTDIVQTIERSAKIGQPMTITVHFDRVDIYGLDAQTHFEYNAEIDETND